MRLVNTEDGRIYVVVTVEGDGGFYIYAAPEERGTIGGFLMHYRTLAEFCDQWRDAE